MSSRGVAIRPMRPSEARSVACLRVEAFFEGSERTVDDDAEELLKLGEDGFQISLVAELNGELAGTVLLVRQELDLSSANSPWLAGLVVRPQFRRRGLGSNLVRALETHAGNVGCDRIYLYTLGSEAFYAALRWKVAERFLQHGHPAVLMVRDLRKA
jgi:predicted N-acetyltransferase YhbS